MYDIEKWKELYESGLSFYSICEMYGLSYKVVRSRLLKAGLVPRKLERQFTEEQKADILSKYKNNVSANVVAREYGCTIPVIKRLVKLAGIHWDNLPTNYKLKNGYRLDRNCFDKFDTEKELYFYGLILADGCIINNTIAVSLKSSDVDILEEMKNFFKTDKPVAKVQTDKQDAHRFSISDKVVADKLRSVGLEPRKSLREKVPSFYNVDNINMRHFWRGFVDGDGGVYSSEDYNSRCITLIGTIEIMQEFIKFCDKYVRNFKYNLYKNKRVDKNCYELRVNSESSSAVARFLYSNCSVSLSRKLKQADKLMKYVGIERVKPNYDYAKRKLHKNNSSGLKGVSLANGGSSVRAGIAKCNKKYIKYFSVTKLGEDEAFRLACEWRKSMEENLFK